MSRRITRVIAVSALLLVSGAGRVPAQRNAAVPTALEGVAVEQQLDRQLPGDLRFNDENGRPVRLGDYFDGERPVVLALVYYECPMLCTLVLNGLLETLRELEWTTGDEFQLVTVSIDPRETSSLARQKKQNMLALYERPEAAGGWHFLTGGQAEIHELADAVGFRYRYLEDSGEYAHPAALHVITPEGRISRYLFGIEYDPDTLRLSLVEAADGRIGSVVDQFLLYCYRYDSEEGQYTPIAMRIMRIAGGMTALLLGTTLFSMWRKDLRRRSRGSGDTDEGA